MLIGKHRRTFLYVVLNELESALKNIADSNSWQIILVKMERLSAFIPQEDKSLHSVIHSMAVHNHHVLGSNNSGNLHNHR